METLIDELAATAGKTRSLIGSRFGYESRCASGAVLNLVREKSLWGKRCPKGAPRGVAMARMRRFGRRLRGRRCPLDGDRVRVQR